MKLTGAVESADNQPLSVRHDNSEVMVVSTDWRALIIEYLQMGASPEDKSERNKLRRQATRYTLVGDKLYRRSASGVLMKCVPIEDGIAIPHDIHSGSCGNHAGARTLVGKVYRQGFYWPTTLADAKALVRKCEGCQFFARQQHVSSGQLQTIPMTWPFAVWGLDMVGPFKPAKGGFTHIFVGIDKFTKWIEAKPVARPPQQASQSSLSLI